MLGLEPLGDHLVIDPALPQGIGQLELLDIPGRWGRIDAFGRGRVDTSAVARSDQFTWTVWSGRAKQETQTKEPAHLHWNVASESCSKCVLFRHSFLYTLTAEGKP